MESTGGVLTCCVVCVQGLLFGLGHYASLVHTYTSFGKYGLALSTYRQAQDAGGTTPLYGHGSFNTRLWSVV
jgi:hypothetical protein